MCGIAGILGPHGADSGILTRMSAELRHRGPDGEGRWIDEDAGLGFAHRRLAVLGLGETGAQPMTSVSGRFVLVYNGEIYNHLELRSRLEAERRAPAWHGASDTETLVAAIEAWGLPTTLRRSTGMWALAVWDRQRRVLTLARDRLGEKPLSFIRVGQTFAFASQPSAFEHLPGFDAEIDRDALADLLRYAQIPGNRGIHVGVQKLPPGTFLDVPQLGRPSEPVPYWSLLETARNGVTDPIVADDDDYRRLVDEAVGVAVRRQLLADVPLGGLLSGGVDSSLIVAMMQRHSQRPVRTFNVGFDDPRKDESHHARAVAHHLGTDHTEVRLTGSDALSIVPELPMIFDEPFADASQLPTILVSRIARRDVTVALSGDGGDELFGGYTRYADSERLLRTPRLLALGYGAAFGALGQSRRRTLGVDVARGDWSVVRRSLSSNARAERLVRGVRAGARANAFRSDWRQTAGLGGITARSMALDGFRYLPDDILHKVDRAAMSVGLETRLPLLDHHVVELAWRLPMRAKIRGGTTKWVLREVLAQSVPRSLFERPKQGFSVPLGTWLSGALRPWAEELLSPAMLRRDGLLDVEAVRGVWKDHLDGRWNAGAELWPILMFQAWSAARAAGRSGRTADTCQP